MREGARQHHAVDSAGRRARDHVDDDAQLDVLPDRAQQIEVDRFRVVLRIVGRKEIRGSRTRARGAIPDVVQGARGAHELQDLLADAVHVDGERDPAEPDQRQPEFFLAHELDHRPGRVVAGWFCDLL
jgi:hypothetical protein